MSRDFLKGKRHSRLSKNTQIYHKPLWRNQRYLHVTLNLTYIQQKCPLAWCPILWTSSRSIKINYPNPSEDSVWGGQLHSEAYERPQYSRQRTEKQLTSFNWVLPDKTVWKPAELSQGESLHPSLVTPDTCAAQKHTSLPVPCRLITSTPQDPAWCQPGSPAHQQ